MERLNLSSPVSSLRGVGRAKEQALGKMGIFTLRDLIGHYPRAYQNKGEICSVTVAASLCRAVGSVPPAAFVLTVASEPRVSMIRRGLTLLKFKAFDESGTLEITYFNQPFLKDVFRTGRAFRFWGKPSLAAGRLNLTSPVYEPYYDGISLPAIVPVYPLSAGISQKFISGLIGEALKVAAGELRDPIPQSLLETNGLCTLPYAVRNIHFPENPEALERARRRLAFDEIFTLSLAMHAQRSERASTGAPKMGDGDISPLKSLFKFELTGAQKRAIEEIGNDLGKCAPMCRILCGDVGSGKTAVAAAAAYIAVKNGYRCALMAPTEILAKQHFADLEPIFSSLGIKSALLCGSMTASEKKRVRESFVSENAPSLIIGTHALISDGVEIPDLGLVITDEQHRFGVNQRAALKEKSQNAHSLVMSATPIPRTLSLVIYGDLDVSRLDEMPPGRQKVGTFLVDESYRTRLLGFIRKQKAEGHRTYIVCPAIEEEENKKKEEDPEEMANLFLVQDKNEGEPPLKGAVQYAETLRTHLPDLNIGFIHGKMKTAEKDRVMETFVRGDLDVLVSTTVIEVGVNVPEATLMVVENAERFGLSQLHQLRGRVGRGKAKSYCILVSDSESERSKERLETMCRTNDGFAIAQADLQMRGPGDFFSQNGTFRQHGGVKMPFSQSLEDSSLSDAAVDSAMRIITEDPDLSKEENRNLRFIVDIVRKNAENTVN